MEKIIDFGLTFDDVLLVPRYSEVLPDAADVSSWLTPEIRLNIPLVSSAMKSLAHSAHMNLHVHFAYGQNGHHLVEAAFKALGLALRQATTVTGARVPSTKGSLD